MDVSDLGELIAVPLNPRFPQQISALAFSHNHDLIWAGSQTGFLFGMGAPGGNRYASWNAHPRGIRDVVPLSSPSLGEVLSVSADKICCHASGGMPHFTLKDDQGDVSCCGLDSYSLSKTAIVGRMSGKLSTVDLYKGQILSTVGPITEGLQYIKGGDSNGFTALGCSNGQICLTDSRQNFKVQQILPAHAGGLSGMDICGGLLATCGWGTRQGHLVPDTIVKVYDLRSSAKVMTTIPFAPGPTHLKFHPRYKDVLYIASNSGRFTASKLQSSQYSPVKQVETGGDSITSMDISSSGECIAFGGSGGYLHLWAFHHEPRINISSSQLKSPPEPSPRPNLEENDSFAALLPYYPSEGRLLSDWDSYSIRRRGLPPHKIDPAFLSKGKTRDFVTYVENPYKSLPRPEACRKIAALRNQRVAYEGHNKDEDLAERRLAHRKSSALPYKYRKVHITVDQERKFQEFNFSKYNKTRFAGLENGIANCYANALIQVLYFMPQIRAYFLEAVPDASKEFSLSDELALLFRMLASESGHACQATNLLRALRQSREATALGLLEGHAQKGAPGADVEVEASKEKILSRRVQNLQRFLLDKLHNEISQTRPGSGSLPKSEERPKTRVEEVFGMNFKQTMQSLQASKAKLEKDVSVFQVDLQYSVPSFSSSNKSSPNKTGKSPDKESTRKRDFADVLCTSLKAEDETRAWFSDELQYQHVKRSRLLSSLPQVLAVGTNIHDPASLDHWKQGAESPKKRWAPFVVAIDQHEDKVSVSQANSAEDLPPASEGSTKRTVYNLTATIALIQEQRATETKGPYEEGHLIAHVQVPTSYLDANMGTNPTPRALPPSPGYTPLNRFRPQVTLSQNVDALTAMNVTLPEDPFHSSTNTQGDEGNKKVDDFGLPDDPFGEALSPSVTSINSANSITENKEGGGPSKAELSETDDEGQRSCLGMSETEESGTEAEDPPYNLNSPDSLQAVGLPEQFSALRVSARRMGSLQNAQKAGEPVWLLVNDFAISTVPQEEVLSIFDGHKLPCLLYYTQVQTIEEGNQHKFSVQSAPVLSTDKERDFYALCNSPPLQSSHFNSSRIMRPTFVPLSPNEGPRPGQLFGLDAEFVAFSPPTKAYKKGKEIETAPSRLGLARISVIRGDGPKSGLACIDDYIRATETVTDYLTQYSGLQQGDLDPSISRHHLCTMKTAYLKLRFLVDTGCIFVGHGLKKDFRMINLVVPPSQVIDTVDLFYLKRQRKLSLRFLAAYLLKSNIQRVTHDSIEDADTALQLYQLYCKLVEEGRVRETIQEMYAFGKQYGWDPTALSQ